jgi:L-malate glycosyltransferase
VRILYFSDNGSDHNHRFLQKLTSLGNEVYFLDATQKESAAKLLPAGVQSVQLKQIVARDADPDQYADLVGEFQSLLKTIRPDVVHAGPIQTCGYVVALSGFHPFVAMSWASDLLVDAERNSEWKHATETALSAADGFFCDCDTVRAAARHYTTIPDEQIVQFPWGIARGSFSPQGLAVSRKKLGLNADAFTFISTRSWEPLYGIDVLLQAFNQAWRQSNQLRLLLLGNGSERGSIQKFIAEHELCDVVVTPGTIAGAEMPLWFRAANAYVSCAKSDGTSVSLLQAMATGLPVIVTDIASNREWITEGRNGWLAAAGSSEEFANKLLRAASVEAYEREAISECNQRIVAERADWGQNCPRLLRLYESLVGSPVEMKV